VTRTLILILTVFPLLSSCGSGAATPSQADSPSAARTKLSARHIWTHTIESNADSAPAYLPHVRLPNGRHRAIVYVVAGNNTSNCNPGDPVRRATTYALNAANGSLIWSRSTSGPSRCTTAGPVVDPSGHWVYTPGLDGKIHRYNAATGAETRNHTWPVTISLMPDVEKMSATPTIGSGYLYDTTSGFIGDQGHYEGHLVTITLANGHTNVFNSLCSNIRRLLGPTPSRSNYCTAVQSGLFGRGQGAIDPVTHDVYVVTGNGPWNGRTNWGDSILKLNPSGSRLLDAFTPTDQAYLNQQDADLGSSGPAILPAVRQGHRTYHLLVQGGKGPRCPSCGGVALRLLNRDNLSGRGGPGHLGGDLQDIQTPAGGEVLTAPVVWTSPSHRIWVLIADGNGVAGYRLAVPRSGKLQLQRLWFSSQGGTTPVVRRGVLWVAHSGGIIAYNPTNGSVLWHGSIGGVHWEYPLVMGNRLFMTDESGHVYGYSIGR
jgi:outer membrane protein assembly factor BamB